MWQVVSVGLDGAICITSLDEKASGSRSAKPHVPSRPTVSYRAVHWSSPDTFVAAGTTGRRQLSHGWTLMTIMSDLQYKKLMHTCFTTLLDCSITVAGSFVPTKAFRLPKSACKWLALSTSAFLCSDPRKCISAVSTSAGALP